MSRPVPSANAQSGTTVRNLTEVMSVSYETDPRGVRVRRLGRDQEDIHFHNNQVGTHEVFQVTTRDPDAAPNAPVRNFLRVEPGAAGNSPALIADGADADIDVRLVPKGAGMITGITAPMLPDPLSVGTLEATTELKTDTINESTATAGVTIDGVLIKDGGIPTSAIPDPLVLGTVEATTALKADTINESTATAGVTVDGVLLKDNDVQADEVQTDLVTLAQVAAPPTPASGTGAIYMKTGDDTLYFKDDNGTEYSLTSGSMYENAYARITGTAITTLTLNNWVTVKANLVNELVSSSKWTLALTAGTPVYTYTGTQPVRCEVLAILSVDPVADKIYEFAFAKNGIQFDQTAQRVYLKKVNLVQVVVSAAFDMVQNDNISVMARNIQTADGFTAIKFTLNVSSHVQ